MKKKLIIFLILLCSGLILNYASEEFNVRHITTDSGFDTSYDKEESSNQESVVNSSSNSNSNSNSNSSKSSGSLSKFDILFLVVVLIIVSILELNEKKKKQNIKEKEVSKKTIKKNEVKIISDERKILDKAYNIYLNVQRSWMNFDYNKLRELVTDELYNMYYNQLQTLSIKGQKNVMSNFHLNNIDLINTREEDNKTIYTINLSVSFYDYIVDSNDKVLRGNKDKLVNMEYELEYIKSNNDIDVCPVCGAKIENGITICPYCRSHIQGVSSKMKLSNKKVLRQW